jgi:hypothetical protein
MLIAWPLVSTPRYYVSPARTLVRGTGIESVDLTPSPLGDLPWSCFTRGGRLTDRTTPASAQLCGRFAGGDSGLIVDGLALNHGRLLAIAR